MIRIHNNKGLQQQIEIGSHQLIGDVSTELGGEGAGPDPHDLFDSSLGTCKAMTLLLYARLGYRLSGLVERQRGQHRVALVQFAKELES